MKRRVFLNSPFPILAASIHPSLYAQSQEEIKIGYLAPMSGPFAAQGLLGAQGAQLGAELASSITGTSVKYVTIDTEANPATAVRKVQDAYERDGVRYFTGGVLSSIALAVGSAVDKLGGLFMTPAGADEITGKDCNPSMYRWSVATYGAIQEVIKPLLERYPDAKRWYTITPQYVFGESLLSATKQLLSEHGRTLVGNSYHSLNEREFSGYIVDAVAKKPDVLVILNFSTQASDTLRQAVSYGVKDSSLITVPWASGLEQFQSLGAEICQDVYFGCQYWHTIDSEGNQKFVTAVNEKFKAKPAYSVAAQYAMMSFLAQAIRSAKSQNVNKVKEFLQYRFEYAGLTGDEMLDPENNQIIKQYYLLKGKAKEDMRDSDDYCELISFGDTHRDAEAMGCKMRSS